MTNARIILTTVGDKETEEKLAHELVERRLAACVSILGPIRSVYRWREKIENEQEFLLLIKTTAEKFLAVRDAIRELHSYKLPECISINVEDGSAEYLQWIADSLQG